MQQPTGMKADATSNIQNNTKEIDKENYLTEEEKIAGTPFKVRRVEKQWFITIGDYRITEPTQYKYDTIKKLEDEQWDIITKLIAIAIDKVEMMKNTPAKGHMEKINEKDRMTKAGL